MWVDPAHRRTGVATHLLDTIIERMLDRPAIRLWVIEGNDPARLLYQGRNFAPIGDVQRLPNDPSRRERQMRLALADTASAPVLDEDVPVALTD
jgi:ribosomal protein S18 acetylase RimI-like enzyme